VDGHYTRGDGTQICIEFLGDYFHGHPKQWVHDETAMGPFYKTHKEHFMDTERKLAKLASLGYHVLYVWEHDYAHMETSQSLQSICRVFKDTLEH
jgi:G:T-mismatch repair DNA endonuclease (very short patch repair protein)